MKKGKVIILSAPSGAGKSTIREQLIKRSNNLWRSISATTREKRPFEEDGKDYYFMTKEEFQKNILKNNFLEYEEVYKGTYYGTPKNKVDEMLNKGYDCILEIDVKGALNVKKAYKNAISIFIMPPNIEILEERLRNRNTETEEKIKERLLRAKSEIKYKDNYDYIVINDNLEDAIKMCEKIIETH